MNWTVTLFPENGWHKPRVLRNVVKYETLPSPTKYKGTRELTYTIFTFADGSHITVLMDNNIHREQQSYRKFEIHNRDGNFILGHGRRSPLSHKGIMVGRIQSSKSITVMETLSLVLAAWHRFLTKE